ncbi:hypothetical protein D9619_000093 [Psilocybe cf. subviscida]|uniref:Nudix hydrolase domain-containing protein n=1 Tax=Psilocybe cf. subviscida TaxID=2480587 RepID=A0A8H5F2L1_9AGAR|nr:hypothetical protein D9619_000093 [Psilocybe cf. subviscida]
MSAQPCCIPRATRGGAWPRSSSRSSLARPAEPTIRDLKNIYRRHIAAWWKVDSEDTPLEDTARREPWEEIGVSRDRNKVLLSCILEPTSIPAAELVTSQIVVLVHLDKTLRILFHGDVYNFQACLIATPLLPCGPDASLREQRAARPLTLLPSSLTSMAVLVDVVGSEGHGLTLGPAIAGAGDERQQPANTDVDLRADGVGEASHCILAGFFQVPAGPRPCFHARSTSIAVGGLISVEPHFASRRGQTGVSSSNVAYLLYSAQLKSLAFPYLLRLPAPFTPTTEYHGSSSVVLRARKECSAAIVLGTSGLLKLT